MTYCLAMLLDRGIVFMSDTRTNAGLDNISTFRKMNIWETPGERSITLLSAGNLATTQAVVSLLDERTKAHDDRNPKLLELPSMFQVARLVSDTLREVISEHEMAGQNASSGFNATMLLGGQIKGGPPRLFLIYPEGNFIEAGTDTPYFQMGETKYGRPILVRAFDPAMDFGDAMRLMLVSFDSTVKANLSVGAPFDYHFYDTDSMKTGLVGRIELEDPRFQQISQGWGDALKNALDSLPRFEL
ncbi:peptidase [Marinovum sp. 2_MG-2023]|uniref:peptidase n=1 Tax=Roseobacteraceae TaxID=2854170 RepID=UPI001FD62988|nr:MULTISPECIES: peptidase [Roseobacteraceae]MCJ7874284.1 peptidase [Phaeobacter sp. J2-8]MDO6730683.1 peptidase [Marinovum sp. 2_MG-2023]MDO6778834.1 peptidase [Marinovum sp. 1_MG-2023]